MKLGNRGFSLLEIMAVLVISSVILVPLMATFTDSLNINNRSNMRRITSSVAENAYYGLEKIDFSEFRTQLDIANGASDYFIELTKADCNSSFVSADAQAICTSVFNAQWNSVDFTASEFKIYMFDYVLTNAEWTALQVDPGIESGVQNVIQTNADILANIDNNVSNKIDSLIRVILWLDYFDDPDQYYILPGVLADE